MELEDLKNTWNQYDKKLAENLRLNEELLKKINLNHSRKEMQKLLIYEIIGIVIGFLLILFATMYTITLFNEPRYSVPGVIVILVTLVYLAFSLIRAKGFLKVDYYGSPVVEVQRNLLSVKQKTLKQRKWELLLLPLLLLPIIPLLFKVVHDIDIYQFRRLFIIEVVVILGLSYPLIHIIYKYLYDRKFRNAENLLEEIEKFEKEV